jgi:hypothetical protein
MGANRNGRLWPQAEWLLSGSACVKADRGAVFKPGKVLRQTSTQEQSRRDGGMPTFRGLGFRRSSERASFGRERASDPPLTQ